MYICYSFHMKKIPEDADIFSFHAILASSVFSFTNDATKKILVIHEKQTQQPEYLI